MNVTRSQDRLWLFDDYAPSPNSDLENRIIIKGASPPTVKDVYLNFMGQHAHLQATSNKQSSTRDAAFVAAREVEIWWKKTGIVTKTQSGITSMILSIHKQYQGLKKH